ncbi:hypothetical protein [Desulforamulus hydrothermalis]|uniref:Uncharacterized protein n=1 Tax=Desulforamulus hydrothermalis Lam5 = DSM 18033 TaxID=1121428 RepID=K8ELC0_9FIRM|nr:hypothetical protein [Desulforamulus hydrothermalis]CCO09296.1 conserved hypothetical protein [Desulforamulus hydrothermalis Lam5 = DSM 18033]SHH04705.1 hypothetical protein SAMN02745177_01242 [Desulforamulus hydrothermalis Lam5 = DSM 18033]
MGLYLDIDLDYFVSPIIKESVSNHRPAATNFEIKEPDTLFNILKQKEIFLGNKRYLFTNHMQSHLRWWMHGRLQNTVIHIDAHSDLYGHRSPSLANLKMLGCQNYLWHAIREGLVAEIYWVFPDGALDLKKPGLLLSMFAPSQLGEFFLQDNVLHAELLCELPGGRPHKVNYHLLQADSLPVFRTTAEIITVATSPDFIPRQADRLISSVGQLLGIDEKVIDNILKQHAGMKTVAV